MALSPTLARPRAAGPRLTYEEFLALDGNPHREWVDGDVVDMVSVSDAHNLVTAFLIHLFSTLVTDQGLGRIFHDPFNIRLTKTGRAPDVTIVLTAHVDRVRDNYFAGPPDLAIEVISPGSVTRDRGEKFTEYESGGIPEYWLIDPVQETAEFFLLGLNGRYEAAPVSDWHVSPVVPGLRVRPGWFWSRPTARQVLAEIEAATR